MNETSYLLASLEMSNLCNSFPKNSQLKLEYCIRAKRSELTGICKRATLGPLFRLQPAGWVAPREYRRPDGSICKYDFVSRRV